MSCDKSQSWPERAGAGRQRVRVLRGQLLLKLTLCRRVHSSSQSQDRLPVTR